MKLHYNCVFIILPAKALEIKGVSKEQERTVFTGFCVSFSEYETFAMNIGNMKHNVVIVQHSGEYYRFETMNKQSDKL